MKKLIVTVSLSVLAGLAALYLFPNSAYAVNIPKNLGSTDAATIDPTPHKFNDPTQQDRADALRTNEEYNQGYKTHKNTFTKTADGGFDIK
jgi:hypothetical protein